MTVSHLPTGAQTSSHEEREYTDKEAQTQDAQEQVINRWGKSGLKIEMKAAISWMLPYLGEE